MREILLCCGDRWCRWKGIYVCISGEKAKKKTERRENIFIVKKATGK